MLYELQENANNLNFLKKHIISIENIFINKKSIVLDNNQIKLFLNGVKIENECLDRNI